MLILYLSMGKDLIYIIYLLQVITILENKLCVR